MGDEPNYYRESQKRTKNEIMKYIKLFENWMNEAFYLEGFKQNMKSKVEGNIDQYIDFDEPANLYYVKIPYDKIKGDAAEVISPYVDGKYPKCKSARLDADKQEVSMVFTNESKNNDDIKVNDVVRLKTDQSYEGKKGVVESIDGDTAMVNWGDRLGDWESKNKKVTPHKLNTLISNGQRVTEAEEKIDLKAKFPELVAALEKAKVPCKVKLLDAPHSEIVVECGWDYPDSIFDKVDKAANSVGLNTSNNVNVCADQSGGTVVDSKRIAGGPKRY